MFSKTWVESLSKLTLQRPCTTVRACHERNGFCWGLRRAGFEIDARRHQHDHVAVMRQALLLPSLGHRKC